MIHGLLPLQIIGSPPFLAAQTAVTAATASLMAHPQAMAAQAAAAVADASSEPHKIGLLGMLWSAGMPPMGTAVAQAVA